MADDSSLYKAIAAAMVRLFRPLVRILLRHGISYQSCADWLRWCFVQVANDEFAIEGRKQSKSRIAIITGITRVEVAKQLEMKSPSEQQDLEKYQRASRVLAGWYRDPAYRDDEGEVRDLPFDGDSPNFSDLVDQFSGGTTPRAMLDEFLSMDVISKTDAGLIKLLTPKYIPKDAEAKEAQFDLLAHAGNGLISTIAHNIAEDCEETWLQLQAYNRNIPVELAEEIRTHIKAKALELVFEIDEYLYEKSPEDKKHDGPVVEIGLGTYLFQNEESGVNH